MQCADTFLSSAQKREEVQTLDWKLQAQEIDARGQKNSLLRDLESCGKWKSFEKEEKMKRDPSFPN